MAFAKGSPLIPFFKHEYNKMRQSGTLSRLKRKWTKTGEPSKCASNNELEPIHFKKIASLGILIISGYILALLVFFIEKIDFMKNQSVKSESNKTNIVYTVWQKIWQERSFEEAHCSSPSMKEAPKDCSKKWDWL